MSSRLKYILIFCLFLVAASYPAMEIRKLGVAISQSNPFDVKLSDGTGSLTRAINTNTLSTDHTLAVRPLSDEVEIAADRVQGYQAINKFGRDPDVDTGSVPEDVWGQDGVYTGFPTSGTAEPIGIVSTSVNDTAAGSGARTVRISGLNSSYAQITEDVTLNGTTEVFTSQSFWRAHTMHVLTSGGTPLNTAFNAGTITARHQTTTSNVFADIQIGRNQSNNSGFTVPAGYKAYIKRIHGAVRGSATAEAAISIWVRLFNQAPRLRRPTALYYGAELDDNIWGGLELPEKTDFTLRVTSVSTNNLEISAGYDMVLVAQ